MLSAIGLQKSHHTLIENTVCRTESKICMIHWCVNCQRVGNVKQFLHDYFLNPNDPNDLDSDREDNAEQTEIKFRHWTMTDGKKMTLMILPKNEFINLLVEKLDSITTHSLIARSLTSYLKQLKNRVGVDEVIVLGAFAENYENYSLLVQDEILGHHLNKSQCSLHPVVVYIVSSINLVEYSLYILSKDLDHFIAFVCKVKKETVDFIKK